MTEADREAIVEAVTQSLAKTKKDEPWLQKNWPTLLAFAGQVVVAIMFVTRMSGTIDELKASINDMKSVMVQKETVELEFQGVRASLQAIKDNQAQTDKRVENMEQRQLNEHH